MIKINKVLAAVDLYAHGNLQMELEQPNISVLKYASEFANSFDADLHILHVVHSAAEIELWTEEFEKVARKKLETLEIVTSNPDTSVIRVIRKGRPFVEIIQYAAEQNIDLIVMGTHGRTAIPHLLIGSEAENTVRKAPCPVMVVRHPEHEFVMPV